MDLSALPRISAGFPSPGELFAEERLDITTLLGAHEATYFLQVAGTSMQGACIFDGDLLFVDRDLAPESGDIIVARIETTFVLRRLRIFETHVVLEAAHSHYPPIVVHSGIDYECWGVVLFVMSPRHLLSRSRLGLPGFPGP
jgi:DNA polymerase V